METHESQFLFISMPVDFLAKVKSSRNLFLCFGPSLSLPHISMPKRLNVFGSDSDSSDSDGGASTLRRPKKLVLPKSEESASAMVGVGVDGALDRDDQDEAKDDGEGTDFMQYPVEKDVVSSSIDTPLFHTNSKSIGLSMMQKMGFKLGDTLGKGSASSTSTLLEPIKVKPNSGRAGIGAVSKADHYPVQELATTGEDKFMCHLKEQKLEKHNQRVCQKLMKLCFELNEDEDKPVTEINPLWRRYVIEKAEKDKRIKRYNKIIEIDKKLEPEGEGSPAPDITSVPQDDTKVDSEQIIKERDEKKEEDKLTLSQEDLPIDSQITNLLQYLRTTYNYCFFCGCFYNDANDLMANCPGVEELFHKLS